LLVHTVSDETALRSYFPAVRKIFDFASELNLKCATWEEIDLALLKFLGKGCYYDQKHPQQGVLAVNGFVYVFPEASRRLPLAWRATRGWGSFTALKEGGPTSLQLLACMEQALCESGNPKAMESANAMILAADGYLREQDFLGLQCRDVVFSGTTVAILLGIGSRGESTKTGRDQGVVFDAPICFDILQCMTKGKSPSDRVFSITGHEYRYWWSWASKKVTGDKHFAGPPHSARHTGASRDLSEGYRSLEDVMKRGRWQALASVHRYAKPHMWFACIAKLPIELKEKGDQILAKRVPRASAPC